jgi:formate hydrogenlyase subunit 6/NADH:ubiquinone oxidoreductase subunit I
MITRFLKDESLRPFVRALMEKTPVIGPVRKKSRFVFAELASEDDLRLDYDTTILPPKKAFFPTRQDLVKFRKDSFEGCVRAREQVLFGVHAHDIKGIDMSDAFYAANQPDGYYMEARKATTIVGCSVQNHYKHAFFGSVCREREAQGCDLFLTKIAGGYLAEARTPRGEALLKAGAFSEATPAQVKTAGGVRRKENEDCPEKLNNNSEEIRAGVRSSFGSDVWKELSEDCFSCGSCNIVCPTCYCFDVQDEWNLDGVSGTRFRCWDACLVSEFAEVSVQGGCENFREERAERYRHRFMRKTSYLNDLLGGPACVGCGRCSGACTADIANPTVAINRIMEL